jgi:hypothetical protein
MGRIPKCYVVLTFWCIWSICFLFNIGLTDSPMTMDKWPEIDIKPDDVSNTRRTA